MSEGGRLVLAGIEQLCVCLRRPTKKGFARAALMKRGRGGGCPTHCGDPCFSDFIRGTIAYLQCRVTEDQLSREGSRAAGGQGRGGGGLLSAVSEQSGFCVHSDFIRGNATYSHASPQVLSLQATNLFQDHQDSRVSY